MSTPASKPDIDVCAGCGRLYPRVYVRLCTTCVTNEHMRFGLVRDFLVDNAGASIGEISDATGLSRGEIARFQSEGRLISVDGSSLEAGDRCTCQGAANRCGFCRKQLAQKFDALTNKTSLPVGRLPLDGGTAGTAGTSGDDSDDRVRYIRRARRGES